MSAITFGTSAGNWSDNSKWVGGVKPTAADDALLDVNSAACTIDAAAVCRSLDCDGYTGTLTHNAFTLTIGDGTAGAGNRALRLVSGMTYTISNDRTSAIDFISTSATQQTVDYGGKKVGDQTYNAASNGSWTITGETANTTVSVLSVLKGSVDINVTNLYFLLLAFSGALTRSLTLNSTTLHLSKGGGTTPGAAVQAATTGGLTLSALSSTINLTGAGAQLIVGTGTGGGKPFGTVNFNGGGASIVTNRNTVGTGSFVNLSMTALAKTDTLYFSISTTITGTSTFAGIDAANRLLVLSGTPAAPSPGTTITLTNTGATQAWSNVDLQDIALTTAYDASGITGGCGDCGGNSNITFTDPARNYWVPYSANSNWSDVNHWASTSGGTGGTGRVPLPQDEVNFDANSFNATYKTVTLNEPRIGRFNNWTGATNTPTFATSGSSPTVFGSVKFISAMTTTATTIITFAGRNSTGTCDTSGTAVTWASGAKFIGLGGLLTIAGVDYAIASVTDSTHLTLATSAGTNTGIAFSTKSTLTSSGLTLPGIDMTMAGGWLVFQDAITTSVASAAAITIEAGTLDFNNFNVTTYKIGTSGTITREIKAGSGTLTLGGTATKIGLPTVTNFTWTIGSTPGTILITDVSASSKTLNPGGITFGDITVSGGGTGPILVTGDFGARTFNITGPKTITVTSARTITLSGVSTWTGSSGNVITINASTGGSGANLTITGTGRIDGTYLNITDSLPTANKAFAGGTSTLVSNYGNWLNTVYHPTSGAITGAGSTVAGSAHRTRAHATSGVLTGSGATVAGSSNRFRAFATSGAITGSGSEVAGSAERLTIHSTSGVLTGSGAEIVGSANWIPNHKTTGALTGSGAEVVGAALHGSLHTTTGVLEGSGSEVAGSANRFRTFATSGALTGGGAIVAGAALRFSALEHACDGTLIGQGAEVAGTAQRNAAHPTSGSITGVGSEVVGVAARFRVHDSYGSLISSSGAVVVGTARILTHHSSGVLIGQGSVVVGSASKSGGTVTGTIRPVAISVVRGIIQSIIGGA